MPIARKHQIDLNATSFYHCISRCVRQAFLCGKSKQTGKNYEHRREWVVSRLSLLTQIFAIKICAYAVMSNHYHLVLHVDTQTAQSWSPEEVAARWKRLFKGTLTDSKNFELKTGDAEALIAKWRSQLTEVSWFMRCLNEFLARKANQEDGCKGRFWEGRYKSQALLDESALLTCMSYVDLNPVRARLSNNLEGSDFTSIQQRLIAHSNLNKQSHTYPQLMSFEKNFIQDKQQSITRLPFTEIAYIELVRWTGSAIREDKKGFIPTAISDLLSDAGIHGNQWIESVHHFGTSYGWLVGRLAAIKRRCATLNKKWLHGLSASNTYFVNAA